MAPLQTFPLSLCYLIITRSFLVITRSGSRNYEIRRLFFFYPVNAMRFRKILQYVYNNNNDDDSDIIIIIPIIM